MVLDNLSITKSSLLKLLQQTKAIVNPKRRSNIKKKWKQSLGGHKEHPIFWLCVQSTYYQEP